MSKEALVINDGTVVNNTANNRVTLYNTVTMTGGTLGGNSSGDGSKGAFSWSGPSTAMLTATSDASGNPATISATTSLQQPTTFNVTRGTGSIAAGVPDVVVSGAITPFSNGGNGLTKTGNGILALSAANTFTGGVNINAGNLQVQGTETPGTSGPLGKSGTITFGGGTLQYSSTNASDYSSRFATTSQAISIDTNGQSVTFVTALMGSTAGSLTLNDTAATKGALTITIANAYTGGTTISGGTLRSVGTGLGTGPVAISGGTIAVNDGSGGVLAQTLTTAGETWSGNSGYTARLYNGGTSDKLIMSQGTATLTIGTFTSANPFTVHGADGNGTLSPSTSHDWTIATFSQISGITDPAQAIPPCSRRPEFPAPSSFSIFQPTCSPAPRMAPAARHCWNWRTSVLAMATVSTLFTTQPPSRAPRCWFSEGCCRC